MLEGNDVTLKTQEHLDRCLTCRNCETTCPSGVRYHNLLDIGRDIVEQKVKRPLPERMLREGLRQVVPRPAVFRALTQVGLVLRRFCRNRSEQKLPAETVKAKPRPPLRHKRRVLMLEGCAQPTLRPTPTRQPRECWIVWGSASCQLTKQAVVARWTIILMRKRKGWRGREIILMPVARD
ncbi:glycolate oxidase iron-sulfur subunit [Escherichia coli]|uniref:Glycolate oxidase iron-sulfur subunit n=1 Tax=Escherichia coli TaxID=562 RepID=A0A376Y4Y5_ECOLX|nr:glycolate oxidase iron-sulfur subunit [Escherichia coli]